MLILSITYYQKKIKLINKQKPRLQTSTKATKNENNYLLCSNQSIQGRQTGVMLKRENDTL